MFNFFDKSDLKIQEDVLNELQWDPSVTSSAVTVSSHNGVVTLRGSVPHFSEKLAAEYATQRVGGVKAVADELEVNFASPVDHSDEEIAQAALNAFKWNYSIPQSIKIAVEKGWITLSGQVEWDYQRNAARNSAAELLGVCGVTNCITIRSKAQPADIKVRIESALRRSAEAEGRKISVSVAGERVTLTGNVHSFSEFEDARLAAFNAPGVMSVDNNLVISQ